MRGTADGARRHTRIALLLRRRPRRQHAGHPGVRARLADRSRLGRRQGRPCGRRCRSRVLPARKPDTRPAPCRGAAHRRSCPRSRCVRGTRALDSNQAGCEPEWGSQPATEGLFSPARQQVRTAVQAQVGWGGVHGPMGLEAAEAGPVPAASMALTLNVYSCPGMRPVMVVKGCPLVGGVVSPWQLGQAGVGMTW